MWVGKKSGYKMLTMCSLERGNFHFLCQIFCKVWLFYKTHVSDKIDTLIDVFKETLMQLYEMSGKGELSEIGRRVQNEYRAKHSQNI